MTDKQATFCQEYLIDLNATQAAIRAGYSPKTANEQGAQLLANLSIRREIDRLKAERSRRTGITADRVLQELARIAFVNPTDVINPEDASVRDDLDEDDAAVIAGVRIKTIPGKDGGQGIERDVRLHDKVRALELLGKHLGLFEDKLKLDGAVPVVISGGDELED